jgi:hypothetical protein
MNKKALLLLLLLFALGYSCKKKKSTVNKNSIPPPKGLDTLVSISAKVNGVDFATDTVTGYKINYSTDSGKFDLLVRASIVTNGSPETITFTIHNYKGINTYFISPPYNTAAYYAGNIRYYASNGELVVSSDSEYGIIGSFYFTADTINVTEGVFNVAQP